MPRKSMGKSRQSSTMVSQRMKSAEEVLATADINKADLGLRLGHKYFPPPDPGGGTGEDQPSGNNINFQAFIESLGAELKTAKGRLVRADNADLEKLASIGRLRRRRDQLIDPLYRKLSEMRHAVEGIFGAGRGVEVAGIEGPTAQDPEILLRQVARAYDRLSQPWMEFPASNFEGIMFDPATLAADLDPERTELHETLDQLRRERKEADKTVVAKQKAMDEYDRVFLRVARVLEGLFRLVGEDELAERVRPSIRRPGRRAVDVPEESEPEEAPAAEEASSETEESLTEDSQSESAAID